MTKEEKHADLTRNVITQEFTMCSLKAVRLADRVIEWSDIQNAALTERVKELENQLELQENYNNMLIDELTELKEKHKTDVISAYYSGANGECFPDHPTMNDGEQYYKQKHENG